MGFKKLGLALFAFALTLSAHAWAQDDVRREGVIISHTGDALVTRTREGPLNVMLTPSTEIRETAGLAQRRTRGPETLIPGLIIKVEGTLAGDTLTAEEVTYSERDWRSAIAARAGTTEQFAAAARERAELREAIINGQEYVVREEVTVLFASGSAAVASQYQQQLRTLARNAAGHGNYRISIIGYADPRGNAAANERLSARRALAVRHLLVQSGSIQPGRVLPAAPMGEGALAPGETAPTSDAEARRVVVRVVTAKTQLSQ
jgi:outer membrane protein OmpA-like peptidoglycan-associated protein